MRTMWGKEYPIEPLNCYEIKTKEGYLYAMAQNKEKAQECFINEGYAEKGIIQIKKVEDEEELNDKRFFIGESGTEAFEDEWASLNDLMSWKNNYFELTHFIWEKPSSSYVIASTWDKRKMNFKIYKDTYLK